MIFNMGGGKHVKFSNTTGPQSSGILTVTGMNHAPFIAFARPGDAGVSPVQGMCALLILNPLTRAVIFNKRRASSGADWTSGEYTWDSSTKTFTIRVAANSNSETVASYFELGW